MALLQPLIKHGRLFLPIPSRTRTVRALWAQMVRFASICPILGRIRDMCILIADHQCLK